MDLLAPVLANATVGSCSSARLLCLLPAARAEGLAGPSESPSSDTGGVAVASVLFPTSVRGDDSLDAVTEPDADSVSEDVTDALTVDPAGAGTATLAGPANSGVAGSDVSSSEMEGEGAVWGLLVMTGGEVMSIAEGSSGSARTAAMSDSESVSSSPSSCKSLYCRRDRPTAGSALTTAASTGNKEPCALPSTDTICFMNQASPSGDEEDAGPEEAALAACVATSMREPTSTLSSTTTAVDGSGSGTLCTPDNRGEGIGGGTITSGDDIDGGIGSTLASG